MLYTCITGLSNLDLSMIFPVCECFSFSFCFFISLQYARSANIASNWKSSLSLNPPLQHMLPCVVTSVLMSVT